MSIEIVGYMAMPVPTRATSVHDLLSC